jgi:DNA-binding CsgD family transcriptional regulator
MGSAVSSQSAAASRQQPKSSAIGGGARPRKSFAVIGLALAHAWVYAPYLSNEAFYISFHLSYACVLAACCFFFLRFAVPRDTGFGRTSMLASCILMLCAPASVLLANSGFPSSLSTPLGIASGIGSSLLFCQWFLVYCKLPARDAVYATLLAFMVSATIRLALIPLASACLPSVIAVLACIPFLSMWSMHLSLARNGSVAAPKADAKEKPEGAADKGAQRSEGDPGEKRRSGLAFRQRRQQSSLSSELASSQNNTGKGGMVTLGLSLLEIAALGFIFGILRNGISEWSATTHSVLIGHLLRIVLPLILYLWLLARENEGHSDDGFRIVLVATAVLVLAAVFFGGMGTATLSAIILVARSFVTILIYVRLFEMVQRTNLHPCALYGAGRGVYEFSLVIGLSIYGYLLHSGAIESLSFNFIYFAVCVVVVLLLDDFARTMTLPLMRRAPDAHATIDELCSRAAETYGLTPREAEVMRMICLGRSKRYIAEELCISEDTVRFHTKQFYKKLNVHNRQELLTRIGVE